MNRKMYIYINKLIRKFKHDTQSSSNSFLRAHISCGETHPFKLLSCRNERGRHSLRSVKEDKLWVAKTLFLCVCGNGRGSRPENTSALQGDYSPINKADSRIESRFVEEGTRALRKCHREFPPNAFTTANRNRIGAYERSHQRRGSCDMLAKI